MSKLIILSFTGKAMFQEKREKEKSFRAITHWGSVKGGEEAGAILPPCGSYLSHIPLTWHDLPPLATELAGYRSASLVDSRKACQSILHPAEVLITALALITSIVSPILLCIKSKVPNDRFTIPLPIIPPSI